MTNQERKNMINDIIQMLKEIEDIENDEKKQDISIFNSEFSSNVST